MSHTLRVNPISCDAHGVCADLLPEMITLDPWGYPIVDSGTVAPELRALARKTVDACPTLALLLEKRRD